MRIRALTPELVAILKDKLQSLEGTTINRSFDNPQFPHLNSPILGSVDVQSIPTWFTEIHDLLEQTLVTYDQEDIRAENFLELKLALLPNHLAVYLYHNEPVPQAVMTMQLRVAVEDIENGSFKFLSPVISDLEVDHLRDEKAIA